MTANVKRDIYDFWNAASCGEALLMTGDSLKDQFEHQRRLRYEWEPEILAFANFDQGKDKRVLEIGVGLGCDHQMWAEAGAETYGIDLTDRAIQITQSRFNTYSLSTQLRVADAEQLPFPDNFFDIVYSWGVILYCPDVARAVSEIHRVLKPGGVALVMLYHTWSFVGYMLWVRYALLRLRPFTRLSTIYFNHLESRGTQAFTVSEAKRLFQAFGDVGISINLCHGDLLTSGAGQRHRGPLLRAARAVWPRQLIKTVLPTHGLFMKIRANK